MVCAPLSYRSKHQDIFFNSYHFRRTGFKTQYLVYFMMRATIIWIEVYLFLADIVSEWPVKKAPYSKTVGMCPFLSKILQNVSYSTPGPPWDWSSGTSTLIFVRNQFLTCYQYRAPQVISNHPHKAKWCTCMQANGNASIKARPHNSRPAPTVSVTQRARTHGTLKCISGARPLLASKRHATRPATI